MTRVLYLLAVAVAAFAVPWEASVAALAVGQLGVAWLVGVPPRALVRSARKLAVFLVALTALLVLTEGWAGLGEGALMAARLLAVVWASMAARAGADPEAFAAGLSKVGLPKVLAVSMDATLGILEGRRRGEGRNRGGGSRWEAVKRYVRAVREADGPALVDPVYRAVDRAELDLLERHPDLPSAVARDAAVIAGISAVMLGAKLVKTLPGLPFAPGHKNAIMLPMYVLAAELTTTPFGATFCGASMGTLAFLSGDGRYGVFEIAKHVAPGLLVDLVHPVLRRTPSVAVYGAFGVVLAAARLGTELLVAALLGVPRAFYAVIGVSALTHLGAGALSGFVSAALLRAVQGRR